LRDEAWKGLITQCTIHVYLKIPVNDRLREAKNVIEPLEELKGTGEIIGPGQSTGGAHP
jgi:hypothetical protein